MAAEYQLTNHPSVLRTVDQAWIPTDPQNADYQEYLRWRADGGVPDPAPIILGAVEMNWSPSLLDALGGKY